MLAGNRNFALSNGHGMMGGKFSCGERFSVKMIQRVCVFCGSNRGSRPSYAQAATLLARHLAANGIGLVYGGGNVGLMGVLADEALSSGTEVIGVIPQSLVEREVAHLGLSELRIVASMHERKAQMAELCDAFIALPGGFGTLEEFCEVLTWAQLGLHRKPCGLLNVEGYFDRLLELFDHAVAEGFLKPAHRRIVISETCPVSLVRRLSEYEPPATEKWINRKQT